MVYMEKSKDSTKNLLVFINEFRKVEGYRINIQEIVAFLYTNSKLLERKIKDTVLFTISSKRLNI